LFYSTKYLQKQKVLHIKIDFVIDRLISIYAATDNRRLFINSAKHKLKVFKREGIKYGIEL